MHPSEQLFARLAEKRLIALLAPRSAAECAAAFEALDPLGVTLEIAFRTPAAAAGIREVRRVWPDALILAGTVVTPAQAEEAIAAGAAGIVSPDYFPEVVEVSMRLRVMCVPGGLSDAGKQLAQKAALLGVDLDGLKERYPCQWVYKIFPAMAGGAAGLDIGAALQSVYKGLRVIYTGGVTADNVALIAAHDPKGIACASALTRDVADPEKMRAEAERWLALIRGQAARPAPAAPASDAPAPAARAFLAPAPAAGRPAPADVVTFGEVMLRLSVAEGVRFAQARVFDAGFGGSEANVAVALARFGLAARFVTALPENDLGEHAAAALRAMGVDTAFIARRGERLGLYFLEPGVSQRPSRVIYDRAGSAVSAAGTGVFDWDAALRGARWFHFTGITPALSDAAADATREALAAARRAGLTVSVDLNYRSRLWPKEKAREVMTALMEHVDIAIANEQDAADVFGIRAGNTDVDAGRLDMEGYEAVARELVRRFGLKAAAITLRKSVSASDNFWSACLFDGTSFWRSREYGIHVLDRVGAGDAFAAGLVYGALAGRPWPEALEFGVAASCLKHTIRGDFNLVTREEVEALLKGGGAGRIRR